MSVLVLEGTPDDCGICLAQGPGSPEHVRLAAAIIVGRLAEKGVAVKLCDPHRKCAEIALKAQISVHYDEDFDN